MSKLTRRKFLVDAASAGAVLPLLAIVGACKSEQGGAATTTGGEATPAPAADTPICDLAKLTPEDLAPRTALAYADKSADPAKSCSNCNLFKADNGGGCPGCTLFKGPVSAEGYCNSWAAKA